MSDIAHSISKLCDTVNDLRNQLDEQGRIADARKVVIAQRDARIAALEAEKRERSEYLVGVIEERERLRRALEWALDRATDSDHPHYPARGDSWPWVYPYLISGTPLGGGVGEAGFSSALEAVEAAMVETQS